MSKEVAEKCCKSFRFKSKCITAASLYDVYAEYCDRKNIAKITTTMFGRIAKTQLRYKDTEKCRVYLSMEPALNPPATGKNPPGLVGVAEIDEMSRILDGQQIVKTADGRFNLPKWMAEEYNEV